MNSTFMRRRSDGDDAKARFHCANRVLGRAGNQEWGVFRCRVVLLRECYVVWVEGIQSSVREII